MLVIENVSKTFGTKKVVENVTSCSPTLEVDTIPKNKKEGK